MIAWRQPDAVDVRERGEPLPFSLDLRPQSAFDPPDTRMSERSHANERAATLIPVLVDLVHFLAFDLLNRPLRGMLAHPSTAAAAGLVGLYLAYALSLYSLGRLKPEIALRTVELRVRDEDGRLSATKTTWPQLLFFYPAFGFGILMVVAVAISAGIASEEAEGSTAPMVVVGAALVVFFIHVGGMVRDPTPRYSARQTEYLWVLVPCLLVSEVMLNLSVALWHRFLGLDATAPAPGAPSLAGFIVAAPLFLLFFAVPRFTLLSRSFTWPSLASALALALWELWELLEEAPLL